MFWRDDFNLGNFLQGLVQGDNAWRLVSIVI
jgi:hypothetical protein